MLIALDLFHQNIRRSRDLAALFRAMQAQTTVALDLSDVLRAALVMSVSALDLFVHEVVRQGMLEAYRGERTRTAAFLRFQVTLHSVFQSREPPASDGWLENQIRERHGYQSFQTPEHIADAIRLVSEVALWNEVARQLGMPSREVRDTLNLIVQRRNQIVHEADIMPDYARQTAYSESRSPIDEVMADNAINFIEQVAAAIYAVVSPTT